MLMVPKIIPDNLKWFFNAKFGMFIHFGLYAKLGKGEWVQYKENIPVQEYEKLAHEFDPSSFDADEWTSLAINSGARYITVTTKHHDGFCLFDSELTDYKITNTPFGRDLIAELTESCHKKKLKIIYYYSQPDWHHPNYPHIKGAYKDLDLTPDYFKPDHEKYIEYYIGQVEELCTKYGKIDGIWFDGSHRTEEYWQGRRVYDLIKKHQPNAVVNERARFGDFHTPERSLPFDLTGYLFEACQCVMRNSWGFIEEKELFEPDELFESLIKMVKAGGNFLLNVGPSPNGTIDNEQSSIMLSVGKKINEYSRTIFDTKPIFNKIPTQNASLLQKGAELFILLDADSFDPETLKIEITKSNIDFEFEDCKAFILNNEKCTVGFENSEKHLNIDIAQFIDQIKNSSDSSPFVIVIEAKNDVSERRNLNAPTIEFCEDNVNEIRSNKKNIFNVSTATTLGRFVKGHPIVIKDHNGEDGDVLFKYADQIKDRGQKLIWHIKSIEACRIALRLETAGKYPDCSVSVRVNNQIKEIELPVTYKDNLLIDDFIFTKTAEFDIPVGISRIEIFPASINWGYRFSQIKGIEIKVI